MRGYYEAVSIPGWMEYDELMWLGLAACEHRSIIEIGSWKGRSTKILSYYTPGKVYAIDSWAGPLDIDNYKQEFYEVINFGSDYVYNQFLFNVKNEYDSGKVVPIYKSSQEGLDYLSSLDKKYDMVFIDADHSYEPFKQDLIKSSGIVDGLICGHDWNYPGIKQALLEVYGQSKVATFGVTNNLWFII